MKKAKRNFMAIITILFLLTSMVFPPAFAQGVAQDKLQRAELILSEPDASGYITASLVLYNAKFSGVQFGFSFDNTVLQFVDKETKKQSEDFNRVSTLYPYKNGKGEHSFTALSAACETSNTKGILKIGVYGLPSAVSDESAAVFVGEEGFKICDFSMKLMKNGEASFDVLDTKSTTHPKDIYVGDGKTNKPTSFKFVLPDVLGGEKGAVLYAPIVPQLTPEQKRRERLTDSLILNIGNYAAVDDGYLKWIDNDNKKVVPFIEKGRTFIPLRFVSEAFDADVLWDAKTQEIKISLGDDIVKLNIGKKAYYVNGIQKEMDVAAYIKEERTIVPVRFISEALGKAVYWDEANSLVIVTPGERPWNPDEETEKNILKDALLIISELLRDVKIDMPQR